MEVDYATQQRLAREACEVIVEQGGDWAAVEAVLAERYGDDDLDAALAMAVGLMFAYRAPGGPGFLRGMRDALPEPEPVPRRRRRWRVA